MRLFLVVVLIVVVGAPVGAEQSWLSLAAEFGAATLATAVCLSFGFRDYQQLGIAADTGFGVAAEGWVWEMMGILTAAEVASWLAVKWVGASFGVASHWTFLPCFFAGEMGYVVGLVLIAALDPDWEEKGPAWLVPAAASALLVVLMFNGIAILRHDTTEH